MITKDAIVRVIDAARSAAEMADAIRKLTSSKNELNEADEINGKLIEALAMISYGFQYSSGAMATVDELCDYIKKRINPGYKAHIPSGELADEIMKAIEKGSQPAPNLMTRESFEAMWKRAGGYLYKAVAEGDDHH